MSLLPIHTATELSRRAGNCYTINSFAVENIAAILREQHIKAVLLDWDGCVMPILGKVHGAIALRALELIPEWQQTGINLTPADAEAAYEGHVATLQKTYSRLGGEGEFKTASHGIRWDNLMLANLVRLACKAYRISENKQLYFEDAFIKNLNAAAKEFEEQPLSFALFNSKMLNPGCLLFLRRCYDYEIPVYVITMTPTPLVKAFAKILCVDGLIKKFHGCEQFPEYEFPNGKHTSKLWQSAAKRHSVEITECAIVEDSMFNMNASLASGAKVCISLSPSADRSLCDYTIASPCYFGQTLVGDGLTGDWTSLAVIRKD